MLRSILLSYTPVEWRIVKSLCNDKMLWFVTYSNRKMQELLAPLHTCDAQDSRIREWPSKKCLRSGLDP